MTLILNVHTNSDINIHRYYIIWYIIYMVSDMKQHTMASVCVQNGSTKNIAKWIWCMLWMPRIFSRGRLIGINDKKPMSMFVFFVLKHYSRVE
jgi:hypothetical protein